MKRLKFGCKFPSKWLSFQSQSTIRLYSLQIPQSNYAKNRFLIVVLRIIFPATHFSIEINLDGTKCFLGNSKKADFGVAINFDA